MSDPLGLIGGAGGVNPIQPGRAQGVPAGGQPVDPNAPSFKDVLLANLNQVNKLQQDATTAIEDMKAGRRDDLEGILTATNKAETAFNMLLQVRNKVVEAYDELKQIRV